MISRGGVQKWDSMVPGNDFLLTESISYDICIRNIFEVIRDVLPREK